MLDSMLYDNMANLNMLGNWASSECCRRLHAGLSAMHPMGPTADGLIYAPPADGPEGPDDKPGEDDDEDEDGPELPDGPDDEPDEDEDEDEDEDMEDESTEDTESMSSDSFVICIRCIGSPCVKCSGGKPLRVCIVCVGCGCDEDQCICGFA